MRVHLLGIRPQRGGNLSPAPLSEADQVHHWGADTVREFLACIPQTNPPTNYGDDTRRLLEWAAQKTVETVAALPNLLGRVHDFHRDNQPHPRDRDPLLLKRASDAISVARLSDAQQRQVRQLFQQRVERAANPAPPGATP